VGLATARAGNVIGGGDWSEDRIVPDIVRALTAGVPVVVRNPKAYRPWQHVLEPLHGYLLLGQRLWDDPERFGTAFNFGPLNGADTTTVLTLAETFLERWGSGSLEVRTPPNAVHEANALRLDCSKAAAHLRWTPVLNLAQVADMTIDWYRSVITNPASGAAVTAEQVRTYTEILDGPQPIFADMPTSPVVIHAS
jgi:CDP-glucose 4,6-dehydratase